MSKREPYKFSVAEEIAHSSTHAIGSHLGAAMLALMVVYGAQSHHLTAWKVVSGAIYGSSIILLYSVSSVYHALTNSKAKRVMEILDHMAIYFLIAGSYTPIVLVTLRPDYPGLAWTMFGVVWGNDAARCDYEVLHYRALSHNLNSGLHCYGLDGGYRNRADM